jgi:hypothetical protein
LTIGNSTVICPELNILGFLQPRSGILTGKKPKAQDGQYHY